MNDVARQAGVSGQTVSRVANGLGNVHADTRARVEAAMELLGYRPNRAARALRSGRFRTIGVILASVSSYGNVRSLEAIARAAQELDHATTVILPDGISSLSEQSLDGVIVLTESPQVPTPELGLPPGLPYAVVASTTDTSRVHVDTDQAGGARSAVRHLLDLGHETVWHVAGPFQSDFAALRRREAWEAELATAGRLIPPVVLGDWSSESGYSAGLQLARRPDVTAVFAANDQMALGLMRACHEIGRSIPGSISVVGFDDVPDASMFWPPLTSVQQDFQAVGEAALSQLMTRIDGGIVSESVIVPTTLVVRRSTGPASAASPSQKD